MADSRHELLDDYLTKAQLAEELHRHPRTIDRWTARRAGPPGTVIGRQRLYKRASVEKWLAGLEDRAAQ